MGLSYGRYLGPYVICKTQQDDTIVNQRQCSNENCKLIGEIVYSSEVKFCQSCGYAIQTVPVTTKKYKKSTGSLQASMDDALCTVLEHRQDIDVWIGNHKPDNGRTYVQEYGADLVEVDPKQIPEDIVDFAKQYEEEIKKLSAFYGNDNIQIKWGAICYRE
jgi:ribosomal protein L37E